MHPLTQNLPTTPLPLHPLQSTAMEETHRLRPNPLRRQSPRYPLRQTHFPPQKTRPPPQNPQSHVRKRGPFISLTLLSRWRNILGFTVPVGLFLHKYPHIFHVFVHPFRKNTCCRVTKRMKELIFLEGVVVKQNEAEAVKRVKKLLLMSVNGTLRLHALRLIKRELGLPEDFRDSILGSYDRHFRLVDLEVVALVDWDVEFAVARVEEWREREYTEKWLSEFETKFAFPVSFPTGFKFERGFKERLRNWQRLPYTMPYERNGVVRVRTCGGIERYEKRAVAVLHELLSLTVEKMVEVDRLAHFRRDFGIEVNVRE